ncbi:MAG: chitobiase/beta-hexosaminidase C-terminal domain-containing protein [Lachnospiraceae bacterium]|nr:chitobiase/beta-hexosaminidase C-terminal domain-containing protein [Lachnospiraceae bacterium]
MKCPNCGKELLDGHMYCEVCGGEINLVPEFEAEVEESMAVSIQGILDTVESDMDESEKPQDEETQEERAPVKKSSAGFFLSSGFVAILIFVLTAAIAGGYTIWNHSTFLHEMLVEYHLDDGNYDKAISYMQEIIDRNPDKISHRFNLGSIYMETGQEEKALELYKRLIVDSRYTLDEQIAAAEKVVEYYTAKEDYAGAAEFLATLQDRNIQLAFLEYMSSSVTFSQTEGTYPSLITLKLSSDGIGSIHYTTDGTVPTGDSEEFQSTIFLEAGENVISAVFINEYGVCGPVVTKTYFIESKQVSPPEVVTYSGTYNCPVRIEIIRNSSTRIYYTTDGTAPDMNSNLYIGNLYVPAGKSVYKFIAVDKKGEISEVVTRDFNIVLDTDMTDEDAEALLVEHLINQGGVSDGSGHLVQDENHILIYEYLYPMTVAVGQDCYYFAEVLRDTTTLEQHRTGRYFGVDIRTGAIYDLH